VSNIHTLRTKILASLADDSLVRQTDYDLTRDYLLTEIALSNANRCGVLSNKTLKHVKIDKLQC